MNYKRSNRILTEKFLRYLVPTIITTLALSLNEFVDSMMVANLLGSQAMSIVNLGSPIILIMAAIYTLLGNGGSTLYAVNLGKWQQDEAGKILTVSMLTAGASGFFLLFAGLILQQPIISLLCREPSLAADFPKYYRILLLSAPLLTLLLTFVEFLPPGGAPALATVLNVIANVVNLLMDYVYIRIFGLGVEGAAWATLTGYSVSLLFMLCIHKKFHLHWRKVSAADFRLLRSICSQGGASAVSQAGFAIKFAFCNGMAASLGGATGVIVFSLCIQTFSIVSVFLAAITGAAMPLIAVLQGQRDFHGVELVLKKALQYLTISALGLVILFECCPTLITRLYSVRDPEAVALAITGLRIFSLTYLLRGVCIFFMRYLQIIGQKTYAMVISMFDGFAGIIPIAMILCRFLGLSGLWWTFTVDVFLLFIGILIWNQILQKKTDHRLKGFLLIEQESSEIPSRDITITEKSDVITGLSQELIQFCEEYKTDHRTSGFVGLLAEEMAVYTRQHHKKSRLIDILLKIYDDHIVLDFRSLGTPFNPLESTDTDIAENVMLLQKLASEIEYEYVMGMNSTRIKINKQRFTAKERSNA